jgi:hypothetical protein
LHHWLHHGQFLHRLARGPSPRQQECMDTPEPRITLLPLPPRRRLVLRIWLSSTWPEKSRNRSTLSRIPHRRNECRLGGGSRLGKKERQEEEGFMLHVRKRGGFGPGIRISRHGEGSGERFGRWIGGRGRDARYIQCSIAGRERWVRWQSYDSAHVSKRYRRRTRRDY